MEFITVREIVRIMAKTDRYGKPVPFSISFVTADEKRGTGGDVITLKEAICIGGPTKKKKIRNPHHDVNFTRNIRAVDGDRIITVHPLLVTRLNGKTKIQ